jgi:hypothetical protein
MEQPYDDSTSNFRPGHRACCHRPGACKPAVPIIDPAIARVAAARPAVAATRGSDGRELRRI